MDDLSGLNWSSPSPPSSSSATPAPTFGQPIPRSTATSAIPVNSYPSLRPTPSPLGSGRNTPLSNQGSGGGVLGPKPPFSKPAQDSFSNLLSFGSGKSGANLTLREQQERLEAEKRKKEEEKRKQAHASYGDGQFFDSLGQGQAQRQPSRTASPAILTPPIARVSSAQNGKPADADADLFAAFSASTKVDNSSYYPPPPPSNKTSPANAPGLNLSTPAAWSQPVASSSGAFGDDDDDPFGLNQLKPASRAPPAPVAADDDDDFLGDLAKPIDQVRRPTPKPAIKREPEPGKPIENSSSSSDDEQMSTPNDPFDKAVAQLVDYGFTPDNARRGLTESGGGLDVQAAVNWLLDDAHRQAKEQAMRKKGSREQPGDSSERASSQARSSGPARRRDEFPGGASRNRDSQPPASIDGDFTKTAAAVGSNFLKTANSLWKTGQKKVQKAVSEFQQDGDPSQPKWMRSAQQDHIDREDARRKAQVTDEVMMLESGGRPGPEGRSPSDGPPRERSPAVPATRQAPTNPVPKWQQAPRASSLDPRSRLSKQVVEEQSAQAYISPARRKKTTPQPQTEARLPPAEPEPDLLFNSAAPPKSRPVLPSRPSQPSPAPRPTPRQSTAPRPTPPPVRPARQIPSVSAIALQSSTKHRLEGTAHFKLGDYAAAHASYTSSLSAVPQTHPLAILLRCNRALTALRVGEPRQAVEDADAAIQLIGPTKGEGEQVELHGGDNEKRDMRELYGKALTRKAEALEQMEKWAEAEAVWLQCVESGLGGPTATAGRQRCQKALAPKPAVRPAPAPRKAPARARPAAASNKSSDAVERLRAANEAAEKEGNEKFALTDKVDAKIAAWRDGKRENLRALLSSLDNVLWEGSGWKKVGLHELVVANKVKIIYMKAIAKTHPDKIAQDASTEVRMIAGTVFSTLNEAWDKFKADNGL
ncbi:hypothetical protein B0T22DRAFT_204418 [Podospora appendiculata]|uniref:UBA domain-containing protein n=1 Tax=Podospora appendiculata TaxID=314037 RepID=A0AAE0X4C3_9PEZI|nr:hypothetical protein B0T22DRAFT_204418 [Podospora appendiculata]